jgi:hypothetical protein
MKGSLFLACAMVLAAAAGCTDGIGVVESAPDDAAGWPASSPIAASLQPLAAPDPDEFSSMTVRSLLDGSTAHIAMQTEGQRIRVSDPKGCVSTRPLDWFSPSDSFTGCGSSPDWQSATAEVRVLDSLYPLTVGGTGSYWRRAVSSTGDVSTRETDCEVTDAVAVALPEKGETPAYVVRCDDGRIERTTWYAPGTGPVAYREAHESKGVREAWVRVN